MRAIFLPVVPVVSEPVEMMEELAVLVLSIVRMELKVVQMDCQAVVAQEAQEETVRHVDAVYLITQLIPVAQEAHLQPDNLELTEQLVQPEHPEHPEVLQEATGLRVDRVVTVV